MIRTKKIILLFLCCILLCITMTGCKAKSSGSSGSGSNKKGISVNAGTGMISLKKVNFYDFFNEVSVKSYTGSGYAPSNTLNTTEIVYSGNDGTTRVICVNKKLSEKPSKVKVYTNAKKTKFDTYSCEY